VEDLQEVPRSIVTPSQLCGGHSRASHVEHVPSLDGGLIARLLHKGVEIRVEQVHAVAGAQGGHVLTGESLLLMGRSSTSSSHSARLLSWGRTRSRCTTILSGGVVVACVGSSGRASSIHVPCLGGGSGKLCTQTTGTLGRGSSRHHLLQPAWSPVQTARGGNVLLCVVLHDALSSVATTSLEITTLGALSLLHSRHLVQFLGHTLQLQVAGLDRGQLL